MQKFFASLTFNLSALIALAAGAVSVPDLLVLLVR